MLISVDTEKAFHRIPHPFTIKTFIKQGIKAIYEKPIVNIIFNDERLKAFLKIRTRQGCSLLPLLSNIVLKAFARVIR